MNKEGRFSWKIMASMLGILLMLVGGLMLTSLVWSFYYEEASWKAITISSLITIGSGLLLRLYGHSKQHTEIRKREGYLIVTLGWVCMSLFGSLPFIISGVIPHPVDAIFETMSGFTTTGATIITDIEAVPKGLLYWRSLTHWIGGMGIIVLTIAILPLLGIGGMQLFVAEAPGISPDKLTPRITETAKRLWIIYFLLTFLEMTLLRIGGMNFFEAINHSFATMATGGFSTRNASIAAFPSPYLQWVIVIFMFLAGINFTLLYSAFAGRLGRIWKNEEFRFYIAITVLVSALVSLSIYFYSDLYDLEGAFRAGTFQVVSILTTTGFVSEDYTQWIPLSVFLIFILFFFGGSAGSTAGGIKIVRHRVLIKNSILELRRQLHPSAVIPVRFNGKAISPSVTHNVTAFALIYVMIFFGGTVIMSALGMDFMTATGSVLATLGNVGPGFGGVGPVDNYAWISFEGKAFLTFLMLLGRLELFTVLILFTRYFWQNS